MSMISTMSGHARRLALPLFATSVSIGTFMLVGDFVCQYLQFKGDCARLTEKQAQDLKAAKDASGNVSSVISSSSSTSTTAVQLPPLNFDLLLRAPPRAPDARVPPPPDFLVPYLPAYYDWTRGMAMFATGFLCGSPWQFTIQRSSEYFFPGRSGAAIAKKMAVNVCTAPIGISSTFFITSYFQGQHEKGIQRIKSDLGSTFLAGSCFWPFVSFLNLRFVSLDWRPVFGSMAGAVWNIYLSAQANSKAQVHEEIVHERDVPLPTIKSASTA